MTKRASAGAKPPDVSAIAFREGGKIDEKALKALINAAVKLNSPGR